MNMQEFWAVTVYNDYAFTLCWKELINLLYLLINWGGTGRLLKVTQCHEGGRLLFHSLWEVKAS